ncbi:MAG: hypothetical protein JSS99_04645 [Actinobacteria bacterium]|nr:hypothetical protein [Actinomycetota bacterium]
MSGAPHVAILCTEPRARVAAAGIALALARAAGARGALAAALGHGGGSALGGLPTARRASAALRRDGRAVDASGRLAWLADRRAGVDDDAPVRLADRRGTVEDDAAARAAALCAELGRAGTLAGLPTTVALPLARTAALDRVLAWHDAIVVVREPDAADGLAERARASLARLGRPVAELTPPRRLAGALALGGMAIPQEAAVAVAELALSGGDG